MSFSTFAALVYTYFKISILSFGGIFSSWALAEKALNSPEARALGVGKTPEQIENIFSLSQVLPGPMASGMTMLGFEIGGVAAMAAIYLGLLLPGLVLVPLLSLAFRRIKGVEYFRWFREGAVLAVIAILSLFFLNLTARGFTNGPWKGLIFMVITLGTFLLYRRFQNSPVIYIAAGAVFGYFFL